MGFFEQADALGIVEDHIQRVLRLEENQAKLLLKRYREVRIELKDRLKKMPPDISAQQLRGVIVQIDAAVTAMTSSLKDGMKGAATKAALLGVGDQLKELKAFEKEFTGAYVVPINLNVQLVAQDTSNFLLNQYDSSLEAYGSDIKKSIIRVISNESLAQTPYSDIVKRMGLFFAGEEWKLHRIARTELHNVYNLAKLNGLSEVQDSTLPDLMKTLMHPMDMRTGEDSKAVARENLIVALDEPFRYKWHGKDRVFMVPPDRPNDRSILVPYRPVWEKKDSEYLPTGRIRIY